MTHKEHKRNMQTGVDKVFDTWKDELGGPFGAVIVDKDGYVIAVARNTVLKTYDPTAHAEINAIREAGKALGTHDLTGCTLYATGFPCPMCMSAIIWANISEVYYGCTPEDAEKIGFRDDHIYKVISDAHKVLKQDKNPVSMNLGEVGKSLMYIYQLNRKECLTLFDAYAEQNKELY